MAKRIIFTCILVIIGCGSFFFGTFTFNLGDYQEIETDVVLPPELPITPPKTVQKGPISSFLFPDMNAERGVQKILTEKSREVMTVWAALKVINGVINVLQSAQVGGSFFVEAAVNPLEFLSPINNILNKISDLLLWAFCAIIFEKFLMAVAGYIVFIAIIPICAIISIIALWTYKEKTRVHRVVIVSVLISLIIPFAIPISFQASMLMEKKILTNNLGNLIESIQEKNAVAETIEKEMTSLVRLGRSILNYMTNVKDLGNAIIEDLVNYFILFIFTNIFIPIVTIFGLYHLTKYFAKLILET